MPPHSCTALHDLCKAMPPRPAQPCKISALPDHAPEECCRRYKQAQSPFCWTMPPKPVKLGIHRHAGSPLCQPVPFRHAKPTLRRLTSSPQLKASTRRSVGHNPLATCQRKAPNLPKRHTQTGLDAKELASEQLRLQFYCSRTGDFFFLFFKDLLPGLLFDHLKSLPFFFSFPLYFIHFIFPSLSLFYPSLLVLLVLLMLPS
jgi:hypothetical protein